MATDWEERHFGEAFLDDIKAWIVDNFSIDELFDPKDIQSWLDDNAKDYGYIPEGDE